ncbi:MAG: hypothetical protein NVS9B1_01850 [Candidatus Dormibacteraceae bacterium]
MSEIEEERSPQENRLHLSDEQIWRGKRKLGMDRRKFLGWAGTASVGAVMAACGLGGSSSGNTGTSGGGSGTPAGGFKLVNFFTTEDDPNTMAVTNDVIAAFEDKNAGTKINMIIMSNAERDQRVLTGLSVGQDLGIFEIGSSFKGTFVDQGYLHNLDDLMTSIGKDQFTVGTRIVEKGHDWVMPYAFGPPLLWARTDRVKTLPKTFDELKAAAAANTGGGSFGYAGAVGGSGPVDITFPAYVWSQGGDYFDPQGNVVFDSPAVTQAITNYTEMLKYSPPNNTTWTFYSLIDAYLSGRVAMSHYAGRLGTNIPGKAPQLEGITVTGATPYGPVPVGINRFSYLAVAKTCQFPDVAQLFMKQLLTGDNGAKYADTVPGQLIPIVKSAREASLTLKTPFLDKHRDWLQAGADQLTKSQDITGPMGAMASGTLKPYDGPPAPWASATWGINPVDMKMIQKIVLEKQSIKDAQAAAVDQLKGIVKDYKAKHPDWKPFSG